MRSVGENWWLVVNYCNALTERATAGSRDVLFDWYKSNYRSNPFKQKR